MDPIIEETLLGGLMNSPKRFGDVVYRNQTDSTETIHRLLTHVRSSGITWVPEPKGVVDGQEVLSYLQGSVPHEMPEWIWDCSVLGQVATFLRKWHDATLGFDQEGAIWSYDTKTQHEVICHNDFAPYNSVFIDRELVGLIDFDLCAPGSRLWDMAYTAYRYIPVMPLVAIQPHDDISPFSKDEILRRLDLFLDAYAKDRADLRFERRDLLAVLVERLKAISDWTKDYAKKTSNIALARNSVMYENHSEWVSDELLIREHTTHKKP